MKTLNMSKILGAATALVISTGLVNPAKADHKSGGSFKASLVKTPVWYMRDSLNLSATQESKIEMIQSEYWDKIRPIKESMAFPSDPDKAVACAEKMHMWKKDAENDIKNVLTEDQRSKSDDALKPVASLMLAGFNTMDLAELKLSPDQLKTLTGYSMDAWNSWDSLSGEQRSDKMRMSKHELWGKSKDVLTSVQIQRLKASRMEAVKVEGPFEAF